MTLHLGNNANPSKLYVGNQEVQKVYKGSEEVWSGAPSAPLEPPPSSGSGIPALTNWLVSDEGATTGDVIQFDLTSAPVPLTGYSLWRYEVALSSTTTATNIQKVYGGPATNYVRRFRTNPTEETRMWARYVQRKRNQIEIDFRNSVPVIGQTITQPETGGSAVIVFVETTTSNRNYNVVMDNIVGDFVDGNSVLIDGNTGTQSTNLVPTRYAAYQIDVASEWSNHVDITPSTGPAGVIITASKTTCLKGEGVYFEADASGFSSLRPVHDLRYRFYVEKAGEQGSYFSLPSYFATNFGSDSRAEGFTSVWGFAPQTSGNVEVYCEVRDRSGVIATNSITLNVQDPLSVFAPSDIYAVSASSDYVGLPAGVNQFNNLDAAFAAIPNSGEALLLLHTSDVHGTMTDTPYGFHNKCPDRFMITAYGGSGRAVIQSAIRIESAVAVLNRLHVLGPFDPTDPFSITQRPPTGVLASKCGHSSVTNCKISGWDIQTELADPGNTCVIHDVEMTDWMNFGIFQADSDRHAVFGAYIHQNPAAWRQTGKGGSADTEAVGFYSDHGPYRASRAYGNRGIGDSVFFSTNSWSSENYAQPPVRWYGNCDTERPYINHNARLLTEGGELTLAQTSGGGGDATVTPQDFVVDKIFHITSMQTPGAVIIRIGGTTLKNFVAVQPNSDAEGLASGLRQMITLTNSAPVSGQRDNDNNPITIVNGTIADLRDGGGQNVQEFVPLVNNEDTPMLNVVYQNIIEYAPRLPIGDTTQTPLNLSSRWTPEYIGRFVWDDRPADFSYVTDPEVTATFAAKSGSPAYKSAAGDNIPVDDMKNVIRGGSTSKGAFN